MWNPWLQLTLDTARLGFEAQRVIALRMLRLAAGGRSATAEAQRMVAEKVAALAEAQVAAAAAVARGGKHHTVARKMVGVYRRRVGKNRRRLSRH
jgi:hypothetical protein